MNRINLNGGGEVEARRTGRLETERLPENSTATPASTGAPTAADSISVSGRAAELGELTNKTLQLPDVRAGRVEQLRAQVQGGNYQPAAGDIADALLKDTQDGTTAV
ncbi:MAG: flagellar biosynthesis anti-sigma factor FlgM [Acidobacteria bacterium]|nr:flagellar biosynthesis anti-sigma factor FlgM [Acidobacteriota bacterium]MBI3425655.1 flagellar biosynthesis anti-sigma factor FlgM [Acidobacteriota bacterium]